MIRLTTVIALAASGCCGDKVDSRLVIGHLALTDCEQAFVDAPPESSIVCPGTEMTLCWRANKSVTIDASDDALGLDGPAAQVGLKHFFPTRDTQVEVAASNCARSVRKVVVNDKGLTLPVDAHWNPSCSTLKFVLDPQWYDPKLYANWIEARFEPKVFVKGDQAANPPIDDRWEACTYPPFLNGNKIIPPHPFTVPMPLQPVTFGSQPPATGSWEHTPLWSCKTPLPCTPAHLEPFRLGLTCTPTNPD
jgi:hypothetical protein